MKKILTIWLMCLFAMNQAFSQEYLEKKFKSFQNPEELVTMSASLPFNQAIELLSKVSQKIKGKEIVSTVDNANPINVEIENMPYDKALVIIVQMANLMFEEKEDVIIVKRKNEPKIEKTAENYASVDSREVKISAVFFESNVTESRQRGMDWRFLLSKKGLEIGGQFGSDQSQSGTTGSGSGSTSGSTNNYQINASSSFDLGGFFGEATSVFKYFEEEQLGEIVASPNIIARDRVQANIQIGSDFSIKQVDFAGNVIDKFYPTGSIIQVTPYVYREEGINYILLDVHVERSSFIIGSTSTEIKKSSATTQLKMLDGEETIIGGLFTNEETTVRTGVPFLKDLPWWFFGLRYIFGSDQKKIEKKELVILLKAELVPSLKQRLASTPSGSPIKDEVKKQRHRIKYYQLNESEQQ